MSAVSESTINRSHANYLLIGTNDNQSTNMGGGCFEMTPHHSVKRSSPSQPPQAETAAYIATMSAEMSLMASRAGLDLVAHFLSMAHAEAEDEVERASHQRSALSAGSKLPPP